MKHVELAEKLNGREYGNELTREEAVQAAEDGLLVVFGASDDLLEFHGVIDDETGLGTFPIMIEDDGSARIIPVLDSSVAREALDAGWLPPRADFHVTGEFSPRDLDCTITIRVNSDANPKRVSHFDVVEDGELYCRGLVIDVRGLSDDV